MSEINLERLKEPFSLFDIEWRIGRTGENNGKIWASALAYVTARAIQERLDEVFGPLGWEVHYTPGSLGVICTIKVQSENGDWIEKSDGSQYSEIEPFKGGISGALKRAAAAGLGIGRYLYKLECGYAKIYKIQEYAIKNKGSYINKHKEKTWFRWTPPQLPDWALPITERGNNGKQ